MGLGKENKKMESNSLPKRIERVTNQGFWLRILSVHAN